MGNYGFKRLCGNIFKAKETFLLFCEKFLSPNESDKLKESVAALPSSHCWLSTFSGLSAFS